MSALTDDRTADLSPRVPRRPDAGAAPARVALRARAAAPLFAITVLVAVAYGGSLRNDFVFDDAIFMERDPRLDSLEHLPRLFTEPLWSHTDAPGTRGVHQYYRPFQLLPLALTQAWFGGAAWPVHLLSLALHVTNALLVLVVLRRLGASPPVSFAFAAVFAVHPMSSEAVLWASDIAGLGVAACLLGSLVVHASTMSAWRAPLLVAPLCFAGLMFKESGVLAPLAMLLYDATARRAAASAATPSKPAPALANRGDAIAVVADYAAAAAALAAYFGLRVRALGGVLPGADALELGPAALVLNAIALVPSYVVAFLRPFELNMYRDFHVVHDATDASVIGGAILLCAGAVALVAAWRRRPAVAFGLGWAALTAAPYLLVRWPQLNAFAERYLYLPSVGVYAAAAPALTAMLAKRPGAARVAAGACGAVVAAFVARDVVRTGDWRDEITIYTKTIAQSPRAELIRNNLALRYLDLGRAAEGVAIQEELLRIDPDFPSGWHNLGLMRLATGDHEGARAAFERSRAIEPLSGATALNLGYVYDLMGEREAAVEQYFLATVLAPTDAKPWYNLAVIALEQGQLTTAARAIAQVLGRAPGDVPARELRARIAAAVAARAADGAPSDEPARDDGVRTPATTPASARAPERVTMRRCRAAKALAQAGRTREAVAKLRAAAWLDERSALPHHYLANVFYLAGRIADARREMRAALARDPDNALYRTNAAALDRLARDVHSDTSPHTRQQPRLTVEPRGSAKAPTADLTPPARP